MTKRWAAMHLQVYRPETEADPRLQSAQPCLWCHSRRLAISALCLYVSCLDCKARGPENKEKGNWRRALELWDSRGNGKPI